MVFNLYSTIVQNVDIIKIVHNLGITKMRMTFDGKALEGFMREFGFVFVYSVCCSLLRWTNRVGIVLAASILRRSFFGLSRSRRTPWYVAKFFFYSWESGYGDSTNQRAFLVGNTTQIKAKFYLKINSDQQGGERSCCEADTQPSGSSSDSEAEVGEEAEEAEGESDREPAAPLPRAPRDDHADDWALLPPSPFMGPTARPHRHDVSFKTF